MMFEGTRQISEKEALDRYQLSDRVNRYAFGTLSAPDATVLVSAGNLHIDGNLELDHLGHAGLIVEGDLEVTGSILDTHDPTCWEKTEQTEGLPFLLVAGNLRARNIAVGNSQMRVEGNADVAELLLLHGFDAAFAAAGTTHAALTVNTYNYSPGFPLSEHLHREIPVERDFEEYGIAVERVDDGVLIGRMRAGLPVLREADDPRPRKTYEEWLADCERHGDALQHVPRELRDRTICLAAVRNYGHAIAHVPRELVTDELVDAAMEQSPWSLQSVPVDFRTPERCRLAVQHQGRMLAEVPVELRTTELCTLAIERDGRLHEVVPSIPESAFTPELCMRAVRRDGATLSSMPERFRTFDLCVAAVKETLFALEHVPEPIREEVAIATGWKRA